MVGLQTRQACNFPLEHSRCEDIGRFLHMFFKSTNDGSVEKCEEFSSDFGYHHLNSHLQYVLWYQYHLQVSIYWVYHFTFNLRFHVYFVGVEGHARALNDKYVPKEFCHLSNEYLIVNAFQFVSSYQICCQVWVEIIQIYCDIFEKSIVLLSYA